MSGIGKGVASSSVGRILKSKGFKVTAIKIDPYINVDAGTMNATEHGEVFVLSDGYETDQDMGSYERFVGETLPSINYADRAGVPEVIRRRNLEYKGKNVEWCRTYARGYPPHYRGAKRKRRYHYRRGRRDHRRVSEHHFS